MGGGAGRGHRVLVDFRQFRIRHCLLYMRSTWNIGIGHSTVLGFRCDYTVPYRDIIGIIRTGLRRSSFRSHGHFPVNHSHSCHRDSGAVADGN